MSTFLIGSNFGDTFNPDPETVTPLSQAELEALAAGAAEVVDVPASNVRDLCLDHPDNDLYQQVYAAYAGRVGIVRIGRETLVDLLS